VQPFSEATIFRSPESALWAIAQKPAPALKFCSMSQAACRTDRATRLNLPQTRRIISVPPTRPNGRHRLVGSAVCWPNVGARIRVTMRILVIDVGGTNAKVGPAERRKVLRSVRPDDEGGAYGNRRAQNRRRLEVRRPYTV